MRQSYLNAEEKCSKLSEAQSDLYTRMKDLYPLSLSMQTSDASLRRKYENNPKQMVEILDQVSP